MTEYNIKKSRRDKREEKEKVSNKAVTRKYLAEQNDLAIDEIGEKCKTYQVWGKVERWSKEILQRL